jgi:hypothetical protein
MRVPHNYMASTEPAGRTIFQVERVEVNVELPPDTFALEATSATRASVPKPSAASDRKR